MTKVFDSENIQTIGMRPLRELMWKRL